jgi:hypothetical protein
MSQQRTQPPRQYGADEVQEILQRTSSLERKKQLERPTLAIEEIEAIAKEAGLDPSLVRRAAQELEVKKSEKTWSAKLAGGPLRHVFEREVDGEITVAMHEQLAHEIKAAMGPSMTLGTLSSVGRSLNWTSISKQGSAELSLFPRDGKTVIRIEVNTAQFAGGIFGGLMGGLGGGLGLNLLWILPVTGHLPWYTGVGAMGAVVTGAWALARTIYGLTAGRLTRRADGVMDTLERRVRDQLAAK